MNKFLKCMFLVGLISAWFSPVRAGNGSSTVLRGYLCSGFPVYVLDKVEFRNLAFYVSFNGSANYRLALPLESYVVVQFSQFYRPGGLFIMKRTYSYYPERVSSVALELESDRKNMEESYVNVVQEIDSAPYAQQCSRMF